MKRLGFVVLVLCLLLLAIAVAKIEGGNDSPRSISWQQIAHGYDGPFPHKGRAIVKDADAFALLELDVAAPDFSKYMVVYVAWGRVPTGGYDIHITDVSEGYGQVIVDVVRVIPGPHCIVTQAFTSPYDAVTIDKTAQRIGFRFKTMYDPCGA